MSITSLILVGNRGKNKISAKSENTAGLKFLVGQNNAVGLRKPISGGKICLLC